MNRSDASRSPLPRRLPSLLARLSIVSVLSALSVLLLAAPATAQIAYDGTILDRANKWDGYPAHLFDGAKHKIWWCSQASGYKDAIYYSEKSGSLGPGGWSSPQQVLHESQISWATNHVCDPSVVQGGFSYGGQGYSYALYFTTDTFPPGGANEIGVAFSNNGKAFTPVSSPVISPDPSGNPAFYGAGMSGVAWDPVSGKLQHAFLDTSTSPILRLRESSDGIHFTPTPPWATQLHAAGRLGNDGQGPDIAYNPYDEHWYAAIKNHDPAGIYDGETRVLRAQSPNSLLAGWDVIGIFNSSVTGEPQNHNPGLGKLTDGELYIDGDGWAYVFFSIGLERPDVQTWRVAQGRFRARFAEVIWIQPQPLAGFGPAGSLVIAGRAVGAPSGSRVTIHWRNVSTGGPWNTNSYQPLPNSSGIWYSSIPSADYFQLYEVYVTYGGGTSESCTYQGGNAMTWCP